VAAVRAFAAALLRASAQTFSVNKVFNNLTSRGLKVGKDTLHALLDELSDAFLVFPVSIFRRSLRARQIAPKKAYAVDPGLALAMSHALTEDVGRRLETTVYLELRRRLGRVREGAISYYVTREGHEVDFVVGDRDEPHVAQLVQSCVSLRDTPTRVRELRALEEAMTELGRREATIVTLYERDTVEVGAGIVEVVPAWRWLLGLE
jgi:Predicted ATPase (AAA+ superfamily)